jgi:hypothetical protein
LEPAGLVDGVANYAHLKGDVRFQRRAPLQLASTMSFILNKRDGEFAGLSQKETSAIHECLTWGRQYGASCVPNNRHIAFFGTVFEAFLQSTGFFL